MPLFELTCTATATISETWRAEADSPEQAEAMLRAGDAEFIRDVTDGDEEGREIVSCVIVEPGGYEMGDAQHVRAAIAALRLARDHLKAARAPKAADKVRLALKSAEGAGRNVSVRDYRENGESSR